MKFTKVLSLLLSSVALIAFKWTLYSADEFASMATAVIKYRALHYKQQAGSLSEQLSTFSVFDGEVVRYAKCLTSAKDRDEVAAYTDFFNLLKGTAQKKASDVVCKICSSDDGNVSFLHNSVIDGRDSIPANTTRDSFIAWLNGIIADVKVEDAVKGVYGVCIPKDGSTEELVSFRKRLMSAIAQKVMTSVEELGLNTENKINPNFVDDTLKDKDKFKYKDQNSAIRRLLAKAISS